MVPYREAIRRAKVEGKHKKQTGGRGQYGHVWLELEPRTRSRGAFEVRGRHLWCAVPVNTFQPWKRDCWNYRRRCLGRLSSGKIKVTLFDGSYHAVDSSEMAFKIATHLAFKKGFMEANPILLEPIMNVEVRVPETFMGDVMGDMNKKRGRILGMEPAGKTQVIKAQAPMAEMFRYAIDLRSMTQGRGSFSMEFSHYEEVPAQIAEQIIANSKKKDE